MILTDFGVLIAERIRAEHQVLAGRWFERLLKLLPVEARDIFPTDSLLDHIPSLILEISTYIRHPEDDAIAANTAILEKAKELGALRHAQRASLHQLLREYQLLSQVLVAFVIDETARLGVTPSPSDCATIVSRLHHAVDVLGQSTVESFVTLYTETIADQSKRLEEFTRMAAHEWRQPLGALQFGVTLLSQPDRDPLRSQRTIDALRRNVEHLVTLTRKLESVARITRDGDNPVVQEVDPTTIAQEAARQLREMAEARDIEIRISDGLPRVTVDVGRLELIFVNLLSNGIKYCDPAKPTRYVEVAGLPTDDDHHCRLIVRDNGIGIPPAALSSIFKRFTRAHEDAYPVAGMGLGLAIVEDCAHTLGGSISVESTEGIGTAFVLTLPLRPAGSYPA